MLSLIILAVMIFGLALTSYATFIDRGGGLIYDTDLNVTFLQDASYARTIAYTTGGFLYDDAVAWVDQLVYAGFDDWRLPSAGSNRQQCYCQISTGLGHLFYVELDIPVGSVSTDPINTGPFIHLNHGWHWLDSIINSIRVGHGILSLTQALYMVPEQTTLSPMLGLCMMATSVAHPRHPHVFPNPQPCS